MKLAERRKQARSRAEQMFGVGIGAQSKGGGDMGILAPALTGVGGERHPDAQKHREQYKHANRGWSFAAIRPIATRFADQTVKIAQVVGADGAERAFKAWQRAAMPNWTKSINRDLKPLAYHPLVEAMCNPNELMVQCELAKWTATSLQATGKAHWWMTVTDGRMKIWPVPSHWIQPSEGEHGSRVWIIKPPEKQDAYDPVPGDHVVFFHNPDPGNPLGSCSPLSAGARAIMSDDAIQESQYRGFNNGTMPTTAFIMGDVTSVDGKTKERPEITPAQSEELERRFRQLYGGPRNANSFIILDRLIADVKRLSHAPQEMDYLQSMKAVKSAILQMYGVNSTLIGDNENANRASATIADEAFLNNVVNPLLTHVGQVLTQFVNTSELFRAATKLVVYYDIVEANDPTEKRRRWQYAHDVGIVGEDDFRGEMLGLPPLGRGNLARRDTKVEFESLDTPAAQPERSSTVNRKAFGTLVEKSRGAGEEKLAAALRAMFKTQVASIVSQVTEANASVPASMLMSVPEWTDTLKETARPRLRDLASSGAALQEAAYKAFSKDAIDSLFGVDLAHHEIEIWLDELMEQDFWMEPMKHQQRDLERILHDGLTANLSVPELTQELEERLTGLSLNRANLIARTESTGALNAGAHAVQSALASAGAVTQKEWLTLIDGETRGMKLGDKFDHVDMHSTRVPVNEDFSVSGEPAPYPGHHSLSAGNRCNCRCTIVSVDIFDDDWGNAPLDIPAASEIVFSAPGWLESPRM